MTLSDSNITWKSIVQNNNKKVSLNPCQQSKPQRPDDEQVMKTFHTHTHAFILYEWKNGIWSDLLGFLFL